MSLRSPLGRARGLGSAKEGVEHWWHQRLTALALIPLSLWFVASVAFMAGMDHATFIAWVGNPLVAVLLVLLIVALFYHLKLGVQVVIEDYVHHPAAKLFCELCNTFGNIILATACLFAVLKIAFAG